MSHIKVRRPSSHCRVYLGHAVLLTFFVLINACSTVQRNPVPEDFHLQTRVLARQDLRVWGDTRDQNEQARHELDDEQDFVKRRAGIKRQEHHYLAISGGGANGAYGAGVLAGWSQQGTRPQFTIVTGVSTGALTAPFAFLGPAYDKLLEELYTTTGTKSIFKGRRPLSILRNDSMVDTTPLLDKIEQYITPALVAEIALEHRTGRALYIGTTNLDAGRPVIWNIGRMADSGHPDAVAMIRQVILASASIPGVFPPVYIPVTGPDGKTYDEMHVDGGTASQMFLYPAFIDWTRVLDILDVQGPPQAYLIRNSRSEAQYTPVKPRLGPIVGRSVDSLIRTQGLGDFYRILALAKRDGINVKATWIMEDAIEQTSEEPFDPVYMEGLFRFGYQKTISDKAWVDFSTEDR